MKAEAHSGRDDFVASLKKISQIKKGTPKNATMDGSTEVDFFFALPVLGFQNRTGL